LFSGEVARIEPAVPFFLGIVSFGMLAVYFNVTDKNAAGGSISELFDLQCFLCCSGLIQGQRITAGDAPMHLIPVSHLQRLFSCY
jgi:hypothetical protein